MEALQTAAGSIVEIPENFIDEEPSDQALLRNFASSINVGPSQTLSGRVFWQGKDWPIAAALEAERADYLAQASSNWLGYRNAFRARKRAQERQAEELRIFEQKAALGEYSAALKEALDTVRQIHRNGTQAATELRDVRVERDRLAGDTVTDVAELQKLLADVDGRINVLSIRLQALEAEFRTQLPALVSAAELSQREVVHQWMSVRTGLIKQTLAALRKVVAIDDSRESVAWIEASGHAVRNLDSAVGCQRNSMRLAWSQTKDAPLAMAEEALKRSDALQTYLATTHTSYLKAL